MYVRKTDDTVMPIAQPLFFRGSKSPIRVSDMMPTTVRPIPSKIWKNSSEVRFGDKKVPNIPTPYAATPKMNSDLWLNLMVKNPIAKPTISPAKRATVNAWLAVPIETPNDLATSRRSVLKKTVKVQLKKTLRTMIGRNRRFFRLRLAVGRFLHVLFL